ncbi:hypothetical protein GLOIN_2v1634247 [Rhizophagus irregularis DAOM 181602=DAOM 197198]|nr:hypothetical protein GLOIN_2v1634247 [Rhizophagus irregularis DAOM 181602=DAOM 197198]
MSTSADNDIISLNFRYRNAGNKNIIFVIEISKDKTVSDLEEEVRKKLGAINRNDFLRQIYPEEKPMRTEDRIFSYFNETPDDEDRQKNLELSETAIKILEKEELNGGDLFDLTEEKLEKWGMPGETKKELGEVLRKYGIDSNEITKSPPFEPEPVEIDDEDEELEQCITEIKRRMGIIGSATGRNEAFEVVGEEASGRVDYAIKKVIDVVNEELIAITEGKQKDLVAGFMQNIMQLESSHHTNTRKRKASVAFDDEFDYLYGIVTTASDWYFLIYTPERIYCSKDDYHIALNEKIMKDDAELRRGVKKVMGVIVGLLKDRVEVDDSPDKVKLTFPQNFKMVFTANETSDINLNCFVRGGTVDNIFVININNNRTVENLKDEIRNVRQDLHQRNFNLYKVTFYQPNEHVVTSVNDNEKGQGEFMESSFVNAQGESTDSQIEIFYYFPTLYMDSLRKKPPYPQDGEKSPIHILIYHSGTDDPPEGRVLQRNVNAQHNFGIEQVQTLITPDGTRIEFNEDQALLPKDYEPPSMNFHRICFIIFSSFIVPIFFRFVGNIYVGIATIFVVTYMGVYLHVREYSERNCNIV